MVYVKMVNCTQELTRPNQASIRLPLFLRPFFGRFLCLHCSTKAWFSYAADAPATQPPVLPGILFRYENISGRQHWSSQSLSLACLRSCRRDAGGRALQWLQLPAARVLIRPGTIGQTVPTATLQIHRRHMPNQA